MFTKNLKQKIDDLNKKIKQDLDKRKEFEKAKKFEVSKPLLFTRKVTVKPLPTSKSLGKPQDQEPLEKELTTVPEKAPQKLVSFQQLEKEQEIMSAKVIKPQLKVVKKIPPPKEIRKETSAAKTTDSSAPKAKMPIELFGDHEDIKKDMGKPLIIDFTKQLQNLITEKGSSLSLNLCENLISELQKTLGRPLTIEDIKLAADFFVKQEKLS